MTVTAPKRAVGVTHSRRGSCHLPANQPRGDDRLTTLCGAASLLDDLATPAKGRVCTEGATPCEFYELTRSTVAAALAFSSSKKNYFVVRRTVYYFWLFFDMP